MEGERTIRDNHAVVEVLQHLLDLLPCQLVLHPAPHQPRANTSASGQAPPPPFPQGSNSQGAATAGRAGVGVATHWYILSRQRNTCDIYSQRSSGVWAVAQVQCLDVAWLGSRQGCPWVRVGGGGGGSPPRAASRLALTWALGCRTGAPRACGCGCHPAADPPEGGTLLQVRERG